jgi:hypothetical protein
MIKREKIYGVDGVNYTVYMTRWVLGRLRFHVIHRDDQDPDPHDHPWDFWTFPLTTYYEEWYQMDPPVMTINEVKRFKLHFRPAEYLHRVIGRPNGKKIVSIVWTSKKKQDWAFVNFKTNARIPWKEYVWRTKPK